MLKHSFKIFVFIDRCGIPCSHFGDEESHIARKATYYKETYDTCTFGLQSFYLYFSRTKIHVHYFNDIYWLCFKIENELALSQLWICPPSHFFTPNFFLIANKI